MVSGQGRDVNGVNKNITLSLIPLISFIIIIFTTTHLKAAVYKCIDSTGAVTYQADTCNLVDKSQQIRIKKSPPKPQSADIEKNTADIEKKKSNNQSQVRREKLKLERKEKACKKLKASYGRRIKNAKARDKASGGKIKKRSKQQPYNKAKAQQELERASKRLRNQMAGKPYKRKKNRKRQKTTKISATHYLDLAKAGYKKEKKRLGCR